MVAASAGHVKMIQWHPLKDILFSCGFDNTIKVCICSKNRVIGVSQNQMTENFCKGDSA